MEKVYPVSEKLTNQLNNHPIMCGYNGRQFQAVWFDYLPTEQQERLADIFGFCFENKVFEIYCVYQKVNGGVFFDTSKIENGDFITKLRELLVKVV